jgi:Leucine-rich repeat (LRR) protein
VSRIEAWSPTLVTFRPEYPDDLDLIDGIERLTRLERLDLGGCGINDLHCDLAFGFSLPALTVLSLSNNRITGRGVEDLLRTDLPQQLRQLVLDRNAITDLGAAVLAGRWPKGDADRLERLRIGHNQLTEAGRQTLRERFGEVVQF